MTNYIVGFYNCKRINSALGNLPPSVYEQKMAEREPIVVSASRRSVRSADSGRTADTIGHRLARQQAL
jgi:hypothetical protein